MTESEDAPGGVEVQALVDRAQGASHLGLVRVLVRPGGRTEGVSHRQMEEVWCAIRGRAFFYRQAEETHTPETSELLPGDAVFIPPGYHCWVENNGPEDFVFFCCGSPPWQDAREATLWRAGAAPGRDDATDPARTPSRPSRKGEHTMPDRFEYKILVSDSDDETDEETLNGLGDQGWELVNAVADVRANEEGGDDSEGDDQNVPVTVFYFKRRKEQA